MELGLEQRSGTEPCHKITSTSSWPSRQSVGLLSVRPEAGVGEKGRCQGTGG